jgi:Domain of unknown function (DUF4190)
LWRDLICGFYQTAFVDMRQTPLPPAPNTIRLAGWCGVFAGIMDAGLAVGVTLWSINVLGAAAPQAGAELFRAAVVSMWISCGICLAFCLTSVVSGGLLLNGRRIGRGLGYAILPLALLTTVGSKIAGQIGRNLAELAIQQAAEQGQGVYYHAQLSYLSPAPVFGLLAGIGIMVLVSQESARSWAAGRGPSAPPGAASQADPAVTTRQSIPALLSLILAFLPMAMLPQLASIILGIVALRQISRSNGALSGRWMAVTGLVVSSLLWFAILLILGWLWFSESTGSN